MMPLLVPDKLYIKNFLIEICFYNCEFSDYSTNL